MADQRPVPRLALNQTEAARALGVSRDHFVRHIRPHLPYVLSGSHRTYRVAALEAWLRANERPPAAHHAPA